MLVPSLVFSAIQIRTSVVDQSGVKKNLTNNHHSTKYFRSPFRLIWFDDAYVPIFLSDQTQLAYCLFVIHILQILATRQNCQPAR